MKKSKEVQFPRNLRSQIINEAEFYQVENCYKISYLGYVLNMYIISPQTKSSTKKITQKIKSSLVDRLLLCTDVVDSMVKIQNRKKNLENFLG
jgi:hypothetical protein